MHRTGGRVHGGQIGRIGHGAGMQRHHRPGSEHEPSGAVQHPQRDGGRAARHPEPYHIVCVAVVSVRGRPPVGCAFRGRRQVHDNAIRVHDG